MADHNDVGPIGALGDPQQTRAARAVRAYNIAASYLAAPDESDEERLLFHALDAVCRAPGIDPDDIDPDDPDPDDIDIDEATDCARVRLGLLIEASRTAAATFRAMREAVHNDALRALCTHHAERHEQVLRDCGEEVPHVG